MSDPLDAFIDNLQAQIFEEDPAGLRRSRLRALAQSQILRPHARSGRQRPGDRNLRGHHGDLFEIRPVSGSPMPLMSPTAADRVPCAAPLPLKWPWAGAPTRSPISTGEAVLARLGRFPKEDEHCAFLAAGTLQAAVHDYMIKKRSRPVTAENITITILVDKPRRAAFGQRTWIVPLDPNQ